MYKTKKTTSTKQHVSGFTIVELLIVIVVIGILAAIVIVAFNGVQSRARDSERTTEIKAIQKKLEVFFVTNGYYPNAYQMRDATYRRDTFDLNDAASRPSGGNALGYCWANTANDYCYVAYRPSPLTGDCTGAVDITEQCNRYTLSYRLESNQAVRLEIGNL